VKKPLSAVVVLVLVVAAVGWIGRQGGAALTISNVRHEATEQRVPAGFLDVGWLATRDEVRAKRPNVAEEQQGMLSEATTLHGRPAKITYYFGTGNLVLFIFTFTDNSSEGTFASTRAELAQDYGVFSESTTSTDEYGPKQCATRNVKRFAIDHCLRNLGGVVREQVFFARTPG
jgi:hypothetical protein